MSNLLSAYKTKNQETQTARRKSSSKDYKSQPYSISKTSKEVKNKNHENTVKTKEKPRTSIPRRDPLLLSKNYSKPASKELTPLKAPVPVTLHCLHEDSSPAALVPSKLRLAFFSESQVQRLRQKVPITKLALPENSLPRWGEWSLDQKLPLLPVASDTVVLSRGKLGQNLKKTGSDFSLRHLTSSEHGGLAESYNSLHDPHARSYLLKPSVRKILLRQGLISKDGKVLCSLKEFNNYRTYLKTFSDQCLDNYIKQDDIRLQAECNIKRKLEEYGVQVQQRLECTRLVDRRTRAMENQKMLQIQRSQEYVYKQDKRDAACHHAWGLKMQKKLDALMVATARTERHKEIIKRARMEQQDRIHMINTYMTLKEIVARRRMETNQLEKQEAQCFYANFWLHKKFMEEERQVQIEADARKALQDQHEAKAAKRFNEALKTSKLDGRIRRKKIQAFDRREFLKAKYFYLWVKLVLERRKANLCPYSRSVWNPIYHLRNTVKYIKEESRIKRVSSVVVEFLENRKRTSNESDDVHEEEADRKVRQSLLSTPRRYTRGSGALPNTHVTPLQSSFLAQEFKRREQVRAAASAVGVIGGMHHAFMSNYKTKRRSRYSRLGALRLRLRHSKRRPPRLHRRQNRD